jgi:hypothetical protein
MTCDDAFDQLTTPGGPENPLLADHLAQCTRCRAMAETLAPAIELFAPRDERAATAIAQQSAARLAGRPIGVRRRSQFRETALLLAAALGGAACCLLAVRGSGEARPSAASCPRNSAAASEWMERHSLPVAMACIACHPAGDGQIVPSSARSATSLGRSL